MINIPGYKITEKLNECHGFTLYRGYADSYPNSMDIQSLNPHNSTFLFKYLKITSLDPIGLALLKLEYQELSSIKSDVVEKVYGIKELGNAIVMIVEDVCAVNLKDFNKKSPFHLETFLKIAIQLAKSLAEIHKHDIVHKDISPHNIMINKENGTARLCNFGIGHLKKDNVHDKEFLDERLPYLSPEQSERINRLVDHRTDFYSLGITFYEMLTGKVPFGKSDPAELIYSHIAKPPSSPDELNRDIPQAISNIVIKLISKDMEDRYSSGNGLKYDLGQCLDQYQRNGKINVFTPGKKDISSELNISQRLYGREKEIDALMSAFEQVSLGSLNPMLVSGYAGIGKSALINETRKLIIKKNGYFISGKYDQLKRDIPYSALTIAFKDLIKQLLTESEERIQIWKERLLAALGCNGRIIIDVIPELKTVVGVQPPVPTLGPAESQNRFNMVFQDFIKVFTRKEHPLVIFLDDLQWIDLASLNLIKLMITSPDIRYLFIIGAYRDNEVSPSHPLMITIEEINGDRRQTSQNRKETDGALHGKPCEHYNQHCSEPRSNSINCESSIVNTLSLAPLDLENVNKLIAGVLRCPPVKTISLSEQIYQKTGGNPFFVNYFLISIYADGLLSSNENSGWQWDVDKINRLEVAENMADLMVSRISRLPANTQDILKLASCFGNSFDIEILSLAYGKPIKETIFDLSESIKEGLGLPSDHIYRFVHDRILEVVYSIIPADEKEQIHFNIGNLLLKLVTDAEMGNNVNGLKEINFSQLKNEEPLFEKIYSIVDQLNHGVRLISDHEVRYKLARLNLMAGKKAKTSTAYDLAVKYLRVGTSLQAEDSWQTCYEFTLALYMELSECEYLNGNLKEADALFEDLLENVKTRIEKAEVYKLKIVLYTN